MWLRAAARARPARPVTFVPVRTWFGFGMPVAERPAVPTPWYLREPENDFAAESVATMSKAEYEERSKMNDKILAAAETGQMPDVHLYTALLDMLIRFNDRTGVQAALRTLPEASVTLDAVFQAKVDKFLLDATKESYHQGEKF